MKKLFVALFITIFVGGILVAGIGLGPVKYEDPFASDDKGKGKVVTWDREDVWCLGLKKQKTYCSKGGNEQCTAKYCN